MVERPLCCLILLVLFYRLICVSLSGVSAVHHFMEETM